MFLPFPGSGTHPCVHSCPSETPRFCRELLRQTCSVCSPAVGTVKMMNGAWPMESAFFCLCSLFIFNFTSSLSGLGVGKCGHHPQRQPCNKTGKEGGTIWCPRFRVSPSLSLPGTETLYPRASVSLGHSSSGPVQHPGSDLSGQCPLLLDTLGMPLQ